MKTKIIATIGPASLERGVFNEMIQEGLDYVRINMAYADKTQVQLISKNMDSIGKDIPIIFDIRSVEKAEQLKHFVDVKFVALSFTESKEQITQLGKIIKDVKVISKIETQKGVDNFNEVLPNSWGVMIARGDLGEAIKLEKVPCVQKTFSSLVKTQNKFLVIATEMLLSMVENKQPSRAEVSDVANAVFENADAVMLSEETAIGKNPILAVSYMRKIIEEAEGCKFNH